MGIDGFRELGTTVETPDGPMIHIDQGGDTLAVAHLDWVKWTKPKFSKKRNRIYCPQLDDRLGVWVILDLLPTLGVYSDVLLTDSEERGRSTAKSFTTSKTYNWMYQFDRRGTDTVLYDYDSKENRQRLEESGLTTGYGSFSDICRLDHLGISGWNVGTGYHHEHSLQCYAELNDTLSQAIKFSGFWEKHKGEYIPAPPKPEYTFYGGYGRVYGGYGGGWGMDEVHDQYDDDSPPVVKRITSIPRKHGKCWQWFDDPADMREGDTWECLCTYENDWDRVYCDGCGTAFDELGSIAEEVTKDKRLKLESDEEWQSFLKDFTGDTND